MTHYVISAFHFPRSYHPQNIQFDKEFHYYNQGVPLPIIKISIPKRVHHRAPISSCQSKSQKNHWHESDNQRTHQQHRYGNSHNGSSYNTQRLPHCPAKGTGDANVHMAFPVLINTNLIPC